MTGLNSMRRRLLRGSLAAGSLFVPLPYAWVWAQSDGAVKFLRVPKIALVLGNSKYKDGPLRNPANDARAIGEVLKGAGFAVTTRLDVTRAEMTEAIGAYVAELAAKKCVGMFYYAGHGVQLAWKNYMLPVDAEIDTVDDVQKRAVEVHSLMEGLTKAANPLNVIILDACRDNPFGGAKLAQQKGLSQMDAPNHTLLAYATSPGNVASDGEGQNGLYTENLLREIKVPEAKLEDVFKRVRLGVRRKSNGAQVPWESTSLEDDFWFIPPKVLKKPSDAEREKLFEEELAHFEKVKQSGAAAPVEEFLRRYPSGEFSELAQLQLNLLLAKQGEKKIRMASSEGNPFTRGSSEANLGYKVGDTYTYRVLHLFTKAELRTVTLAVERITESEVVFSNGSAYDLLGNLIRQRDGRRYTPTQFMPLEFAVGKRWPTRYVVTLKTGEKGDGNMEARITAREKVVVPAGTFDAFRIEYQGLTSGLKMGDVTVQKIVWYAPDQVRNLIAVEETNKIGPKFIVAYRSELAAFKQS